MIDFEVRLGPLTVAGTAAETVNCAAYHCGIPVLSALSVTNAGTEPTPPFTLGVELKGYSRLWEQQVNIVRPGETLAFGPVPLSLDYERLEGQEGRRRALLRIAFDDRVVHEHLTPVLGFYEWSFDPAQKHTLAAFVQPSHPVVQEVCLDSAERAKTPSFSSARAPRAGAREREGVLASVKAVYETLRKGFRIRYAAEAPSFERDSQVLRPPHRVIPNLRQKRGEGTCIDLALLAASCLESLRLQPLLLFLQGEGCVQHALLCCWLDVTERFEPILTDRARVQAALDAKQLVAVEITGVTDRWPRGLSWARSVREAAKAVGRDRFLFALDVAACRQTIPPLQFPLSPGVSGVVGKAGALAKAERSRTIETRHLLVSLLDDSAAGDRVGKVLELAGAVVPPSGAQQRSGQRRLDGAPRPTLNFRRATEDARIIAGDSGSGFVEREHLFYALLLSQSSGVDTVLQSWGTNRERVREVFEALSPIDEEILVTQREPPGDR